MKKTGAPRRNKNASKKRVARDRIAVNLSISEGNGLLDLFDRYLSVQGVPATDENIKQLASDWAYQYWGERLKREIETNGEAIIL
jgi:hypothetical protein